MWTAVAVGVIFVIIIGVVECKQCPYKKWLCYASSEKCYAKSGNMTGGRGIFGRLRAMITRCARTEDAVNAAPKSKSE